MVEISNLQATGINEFLSGLYSQQCRSTRNNSGCMTFIPWPPLVHRWVASKLFAAIDTLRLSHLYVLYFTVWDFTSSLFSRRLVRVKARERGLQPALRGALWERKELPACYPVPAEWEPAARGLLPCRYPAEVRASPSVLRCHGIKNPFLEVEQLWSCSSLAPRWLALAGSWAAGRAAFPSLKGSWVSLNDGAKVQRL